jgi:NAD(P)-dependent dehydrogenase (short-subunit alcohol dehydrogenase family)
VTGASSGIGKSLALRFSHHGARVVLASRNEKKLKELANLIKSSGNEDVIFGKTDVSVEKDVIDLVKKTLTRWGRIDILVSNAGQYIQGFVKDIDRKDFHKSFEVNFFGSFSSVKQVMPVMANQGSGYIVFINTLDSKKGIIGDGPYVAAKSALDGFADVLRQEVREMGIRVLTVYPGRVDTPMIQDLKVPRISPKISADKVTDAVIKGILKNKKIVVVPGMFTLLGALNNLIPGIMDGYYRIFHIEGEKTSD